MLMFLETSAQHPLYKIIPPEYELEHIKFNFKDDPGIFSDIAEDKEGYLWLSGTKGLHVFDGHNLTAPGSGNMPFRPFTNPASDWPNYYTMQQDGNIWIAGTFDWYLKFDPFKRSFVDSFYYKPEPGEKGYVLASKAGQGLFFTKINYRKKLIALFNRTENGAVIKIAETGINTAMNTDYHLAGNNHWLLNGDQAVRVSIDGKNISRYSYPNGPLPHLLVYSFDSAIYIADNEHHAIYTWNERTDKLELFLNLPSIIEPGKMQVFYIENNKVYIGSNLYLFIIDRAAGTIQDISPQFALLARKEAPNSLSEGLSKFFRQRDGSILLMTASSIYRLKKKIPPPEQFRQPTNAEQDPTKPLSYRALAEDNHKNIYASYYTGLLKKKTGSKLFSSMPVKQYLNGNQQSTYSLHYWNGNLLWNNIKIDLATGKHSYLFDTVSSGHCTQFLQHDSLWLYQWGSTLLHCYDLKHATLTSYTLGLVSYTANTSGAIDINDMIADANGENLWIGSHSFGLCLISKKGKLIKQYKHEQLLTTDDYITDLELTGDNLWFGCTDGLGTLNTITAKATIYKDPFINNGRLTNRSVFTIQPDTTGNFYLGSSYGLVYFNTKNTTFYHLPEGHPLSTPEFNRASVLRTVEHRYYFGSTDGLYSFTANDLEFSKSSKAIKRIKLYSIAVFNSKDNAYHYLSENLDSLGKLTLNPFDNNIEFNFSVPEFYLDVYYSYRIKGQGDNWTAYKPENKILLYGLQTGSYTLEIKASTSLSDEHASYYSLPIEMKQVWYKKGWVVALFSMAAVLFLFGLLRYLFNQKIKRQKDLAALRTRISSDLHDDVGTILSGLAMQSQVLTLTAKEEQKKSLKEISEMSRDAMEHMRDTVWAMDSRKDRYENLIDRMRDFAEKNLAMNNKTHEFIISDIDTKRFIDPEKRQTIYLIFKEAITNIIKHSDGKHVAITFAYTKNNLRLTIHDNGTEKQSSKSDGLGLSNMIMRAEKIGGTLSTRYHNGFLVELIV